MKEIQNSVLTAALAVCKNAAFLPDGNTQTPTEFAEALGDALFALADAEREQYQDFLSPEQMGLNSAQVALQRAFMHERSRKLEMAIDAADRLYLAIFDEVTIPGAVYQIKKTDSPIRYLSQESIRIFLDKYKDFRA
jgi:hypothetical protein